MAVSPPAVDIAMTGNLAGGSTTRAVIGTLQSSSNKTGGGLPITGASASSLRVSNDTVQNGNTWEAGTDPGDVTANTKLLIFTHQFNAPNRLQMATTADGGIQIRIISGSGNDDWRAFIVNSQDLQGGFSQPGSIEYVVDFASRDFDLDNGDFDPTDVQAYGYTMRAAAVTGSIANNNNHWTFFSGSYIADTGKDATNIILFTGTAHYDDIIDEILGTTVATRVGAWVQRLGSTYFIPAAFQIGDSSTATNFDDAGATVLSPNNNDTNDPRYRITRQAERVYVALRDNVADDCILSGTYFWGTRAAWDLDVGVADTHASAITITDATFNGVGLFGIGATVSGAAIFNSCEQVVIDDDAADIDASTFSNLAGAYGLVLPNAMTITDMNFSAYAPDAADTGLGTASVTSISATVTNISQAASAVVDATAHGYLVGDTVTMTGVAGMTEVNDNQYTITAVTANDFTLNVNSSGFTAYTSGGTAFSRGNIDSTAHGFGVKHDDINEVLYSDGGGTAIAGLTDGVYYWAKRIDADDYSLHTSYDNAVLDIRIDLDTTGSGTSHSFTPERHAIYLDTAGDYVFTSTSFDDSGTADVVNVSGGAITISVTGGGTAPSVSNRGSSTTTVTNAVTLRVTCLSAGAAVEGAFVQLIATETLGTITIGDVIMEGLSNSSGIVEDVAFNYEAAFGAGIDFDISVAKGSEAPTFVRQESNDTITSSGYSATASLVSDD